MKLSLKWLSEFTDIKATAKEFADRMTMSGSKVETVEFTGERINNVVAGRVLSTERHPDSDHLWICSVDVGESNPLQIVTGAQNVNVGDMVPVAKDGASLPGGVTIKTGKLRGVESAGMLCSLKELGLEVRDFPYAIENGIFIMQEPCKPGDDIRTVLGLDDTVIDFEITNNRPDCFSIRGLARESAVTFAAPLKLAEPKVKGSGGDIHDFLDVNIVASDLCPRYTARVVKNIRIAPSPRWMRERLRACGVRPINNIVDITNYVMLEYGQPMHAFDYSCITGKRITVRRAAAGEVTYSLDGNQRVLNPNMLVIADDEKAVGIAGVMGGLNSEITDNTKLIVFESANFSGVSIRKTALSLGMRTDASARYEKGLDPLLTLPAVNRACELVELLDAGDVIDGTIDVIGTEISPVKLELQPDKINALLGTDLKADYMLDILHSLGFTSEGQTLTVPSWRSDVRHYSDVAEEVARFYGYNVIGSTMFSGSTAQGGYSDSQKFENLLGSVCRSLGYTEIYTYSFIGQADYDRIGMPKDSPLRRSAVILNPLGENTSIMRTTMLPSMLEALELNYSKRNECAALYEISRVYLPQDGKALADEKKYLSLGVYGGGADFFTLKGAVEAVFKAMRVRDVRYEAEHNEPSYHPGRCAAVTAGGKRIGTIGQIHPLVAKEFGIDIPVFAAELDTAVMYAMRSEENTYSALPRFPSVMRDIAVVCDNTISAQQLTDCIKNAGGILLRNVKLFDVYTGSNIPDGKKSVAFSLTLRADDATLTVEQAENEIAAILTALENELGAVIR